MSRIKTSLGKFTIDIINFFFRIVTVNISTAVESVFVDLEQEVRIVAVNISTAVESVFVDLEQEVIKIISSTMKPSFLYI